MAKRTAAIVSDRGAAEAGPGVTRTWASNHATYLAGRAHIDGVDAVAVEMEAKWGADRLRLLVSPELRERFDRQRYLMNRAIWHGDLDDVRTQSARMVKAWRALDAKASQEGHQRLSPRVWEVALADGTVAALVPTAADAMAVVAEGRKLNVYTLDEIARLLDGYPLLAKVKAAFPGATVTATRGSVDDPLDTMGDSREPLDDPLPF